MDRKRSGQPQEVPPKPTPARVFIACLRCKVRKIRCDGRTPSCTNCVSASVECIYAPARRYRGPAKSKRKSDSAKQAKRASAEQTTAAEAFLLELPIHLRPRVQRLRFMDYLLVYGKHLDEWRAKTNADAASRIRSFAPLMPRDVAVPLMDNSFAEVMDEHQVLEQTEFMTLIEAQYAASSTEPAGSFARWAIINAITALAVRTRTAPGSETEFCQMADTLYQNATIVLPEIILQDPCELSIQALLAMAIFADSTRDAKACIMLATNAARQLDLVTTTSPALEAQRYLQLRAAVSALEMPC